MDETILRLMLVKRGFKVRRSESKKAWYVNDGQKDWVAHTAQSLYNRLCWLLLLSH